jgi:hypothetical protein
MKILNESRIVPLLAAVVLLGAGCKPAASPPAAPSEPANAANAATPSAPTNAIVAAPPAATNAVTAVALTPEQAAAHVGEEATVRGRVFGVHVTAKGDIFMNIGAAYPNQPFTVVCFHDVIPADDLVKFDGKTISVRGKIKDHNDRPEIILDELNQISE